MFFPSVREEVFFLDEVPFFNHDFRQRKELTHQNLVSEVIQQLTARFPPNVTLLKKKIESLIEREYLERIEDRDPPAYRYLA